MATRSFISMALAAVMLLGGTTPTAAEDAQVLDERPLTPREEAASDRRTAAAEAYVASMQRGDDGLVALSCVMPASGDLTATATRCSVPQAFLPVEARDQIRGHYCGPAVGQVIANYSWAVSSGANKYTQTKIAGWMYTDVYGGTSAPYLERGLEIATAKSPRRPANWDWVVTYLTDKDNDGTTGDQLHAYVQSNVSSSKMPLAIPVKPHDPNSHYYLTSWPKAVRSPGHWIAVYGWVGNWTGTDYARTYYTDSSKDEGGSTGKFWDPTRHLAFMIGEHTGRIVW